MPGHLDQDATACLPKRDARHRKQVYGVCAGL